MTTGVTVSPALVSCSRRGAGAECGFPFVLMFLENGTRRSFLYWRRL